MKQDFVKMLNERREQGYLYFLWIDSETMVGITPASAERLAILKKSGVWLSKTINL